MTEQDGVYKRCGSGATARHGRHAAAARSCPLPSASPQCRPYLDAHFEYVCVGQVVGAEANEVDHGGQLAVVLRAHLGGVEGAGGADVLGGITCITCAASGSRSKHCQPGEPPAAVQQVHKRWCAPLRSAPRQRCGSRAGSRATRGRRWAPTAARGGEAGTHRGCLHAACLGCYL